MATMVVFWVLRGGRLDLDEGIGTLIGCYRKAEALSQLRGDPVGGPARFGQHLDLCATDLRKCGESVFDQGDDPSFTFGTGVRRHEADADAEAGRHAGDARAGGVAVGSYRNGVNEA